MFYTKEEYPKNIRYIRTTPYNKMKLIERFGQPSSNIFEEQRAYIEFNVDDNTWVCTPEFAWLYRDEPPLTEVEDLI